MPNNISIQCHAILKIALIRVGDQKQINQIKEKEEGEDKSLVKGVNFDWCYNTCEI